MSKLKKIIGATALVATLGFAGATTFAADLSDIPGAMISDHEMPTIVIGQDAKVADVLSAIDVAAVLANVKEESTTGAGTVEFSTASGTASNTKIETPNIGTSKAFSDIALSGGKVKYTLNDNDEEVDFKTYISVENTTTGYDTDNGIKASVAVKNFKYTIDFTKTNADGVNVNDTADTDTTNKEINIFGGLYTLDALTSSEISFSPGVEQTVNENQEISFCGKKLKFINICCDCYGGNGGVQVTNIDTGTTTSVSAGQGGAYGSTINIPNTDLRMAVKVPIESSKTSDGKGSITIRVSDKGAKITLNNGKTYDQNLKEDTNGKYYVNFVVSTMNNIDYLKQIEVSSSQNYGGNSYQNSNAVVEGGTINFPKNLSKLVFTTNEASIDKTDVVVTSSRDTDLNKARLNLKFTTSHNQNINNDIVVQNVTNADTPVYIAALDGDIYRVDTKVNNSNTNEYFLKYSKISYSDTVNDTNMNSSVLGLATINATSNGKVNVNYSYTTTNSNNMLIADVKDNMGQIKLNITGGDINVTISDKESKNTTISLNSINQTTGDKVASVSIDGISVDKDKSKRINYGTIATRGSDTATVTLFKEPIKANIRVDATDASFDLTSCKMTAGSAGGCTYSGTNTAKAGDTIGDSSCASCKLIKINSVGSGAAPTKVMSVGSVAKYDIEVSATAPTNNMVVVGGTAINKITAALKDKPYPSYGAASGLVEGQYRVKMQEVGGYNVLIIEGYEAAQTKAGAQAVINAIKGITPMSGMEVASNASNN